MNGKISQELQVFFRANLLGITERLGCQSLEGQGALGINGEPGRMVMIAANCNCSVALHPLDGFMWSWPIVHQIANAPKLVEIALRKGFQRRQIGMNIGNDDDLHRTPSLWRTLAATSERVRIQIFAEAFETGRRLPDETSSGVIIRPSISIRMEQRFRRTPSPYAPSLVDA